MYSIIWIDNIITTNIDDCPIHSTKGSLLVLHLSIYGLNNNERVSLNGTSGTYNNIGLRLPVLS